jgi:hypothetical protein
MKRLIAAVSSLTLANVPRRIACLVMMPKKTSINRPSWSCQVLPSGRFSCASRSR